MAKISCPKCGITIPLNVYGSKSFNSESSGVIVPGSLFLCPSCGANFDMSQAKLSYAWYESRWMIIPAALVILVIIILVLAWLW